MWRQGDDPSTCGTPARALRTGLYGWFEQPLGRSVQAAEVHRLRSILPQLRGRIAVQVGRTGKMRLLDSSPMPVQLVLDADLQPSSPSVGALPEALPFEGSSIDLVVLPHTLDFSLEPHQVLRETHRVLAPEGHIVLLGFNPMSLWGLVRLLQRHTQVPWSGQFIHLFRLKDWLALLDFEWVAGHMVYYRPPLGREGLMDRLYFMETIGDRWWPLGAGVYVIVARKRVAGLTPVRPAWKARPQRPVPIRYPAGARRG